MGLALLGLARQLSAALSVNTCFTLTSRFVAVVASAVRGAGPSRVLLVSALASALVLLVPVTLGLLPD